MDVRRFAAGLLPAALTAAVTVMAPWAALPHSFALVDGSDPQLVLSAAGQFGTAELRRDGLDDPLIRGQIDGKDYMVYFYGCERGADCTNLLFVARWQSDHFNDKSMGDWNRKKRFGKAYLDDDGNPSVELSVNLRHGVSRGNLVDTFDWWRLIMVEFADFFGL
jgi:hypothetical protein